MDELEDVDASFIVVVVDESEPATVDEVDGDSAVVVEVGSNVVGGRIVSPGATVATGFVEVVSPAAERFVALFAQAANNRPQAKVTATARMTSRRRVVRVPSMIDEPTHKVNAVDNGPGFGPDAPPAPKGAGVGGGK